MESLLFDAEDDIYNLFSNEIEFGGVEGDISPDFEEFLESSADPSNADQTSLRVHGKLGFLAKCHFLPDALREDISEDKSEGTEVLPHAFQTHSVDREAQYYLSEPLPSSNIIVDTQFPCHGTSPHTYYVPIPEISLPLSKPKFITPEIGAPHSIAPPSEGSLLVKDAEEFDFSKRGHSLDTGHLSCSTNSTAVSVETKDCYEWFINISDTEEVSAKTIDRQDAMTCASDTAVNAMPACPGKLPYMEDLVKMGIADMKFEQACTVLNVGGTMLKQHMRAMGIERWPYRHRSSMVTLLHKIQSSTKYDSKEQAEFVEQVKHSLQLGVLTKEVKVIRQSFFKDESNFKARKKSNAKRRREH